MSCNYRASVVSIMQVRYVLFEDKWLINSRSFDVRKGPWILKGKIAKSTISMKFTRGFVLKHTHIH